MFSYLDRFLVDRVGLSAPYVENLLGIKMEPLHAVCTIFLEEYDGCQHMILQIRKKYDPREIPSHAGISGEVYL